MPRRPRLAFESHLRAARAGQILAEAGYTEERVCALLDIRDLLALRSQDLPTLLRRTSGGSSLDTLVRLFVLGTEVERAAGIAAAAEMALDDWCAAGLLEEVPGGLRGRVELHPYQGVVVAVDRRLRGGRMPRDFVMPIAGSSRKLANATIRSLVGRTLDLGTGSGIQACLAARHSGHVLGVDRNATALSFAEFNAHLNDLSNIRFAEGDFLRPPGDGRYDLILANPPFVLSPKARYTFRDSGHPGDELFRRILMETAARLAEGGFGQVIGNWLMLSGEDAAARLARWFEGTGCDVWVLAGKPVDPAEYAANWIRQTEGDRPAAFARELEAWIAYFDSLGTEAIGHGVVTLRRSSGRPNWFRMDEEPVEAGKTGEAIRLGFELRAFLDEAHDDETLLAVRFRVSPDLRVLRELGPAPNGLEVLSSRIRLVKGLAYEGSVNDDVLALLSECHGEKTLGQIVDGIARSSGRAPSTIFPACVRIVRQLVEPGFLLPVRPDVPARPQ